MRRLHLAPIIAVFLLLVSQGAARGDDDAPTSQSDDERARAQLELLLGTWHRVDASGKTIEINRKSLVPTPDLVGTWLVEHGGYTGPEGFWDDHLKRKVCLLDYEKLRGKAKAPVCDNVAGINWPTSPDKSLAARIFFFELYASYVKDTEHVAKARHEFARRLGWQPVWFWVTEYESSYAFRPVPMEQWPPRVLELALGYADDTTKKELRAAMKRATPYGCAWSGGGLVRERRGASFGPPKYDPNLTVRPDIAGSGGEIPCEEVAKVVRDRSAPYPKNVLAIETIEGQPWQTNKDSFDRPTSMTRVVRIYSRVARFESAAVQFDGTLK